MMQHARFFIPWVWHILLAIYWLLLFTLTHLPAAGRLALTTTHDKLAHAAAFAVLAAIFATTWQVSAGRLTLPQLAWAWLIVVFYAGLDEWTQAFVGRQTSMADWIADAAGAAVGLAAFVVFRRLSRRYRGDESAEAT